MFRINTGPDLTAHWLDDSVSHSIGRKLAPGIAMGASGNLRHSFYDTIEIRIASLANGSPLMPISEPINDLHVLLGSMSPSLDPRTFVFATVPDVSSEAVILNSIMIFRETEGVSLILEEAAARSLGIEGTFRCRMLTLNVLSALEAVGFLATILPELSKAGMGVNPVSAYYHDHLFVPADRAEDALQILRTIASESVSKDYRA